MEKMPLKSLNFLLFEIRLKSEDMAVKIMPLIFTIAPMLTMGMMSMVTGFTAVQKIIDGESTIKQQLSPLIMCACMIVAMLIFPLAQKFYTKKQKEY